MASCAAESFSNTWDDASKRSACLIATEEATAGTRISGTRTHAHRRLRMAR